MNLNHLFTTKANCFLPLGDTDTLHLIMNQELRVFWDGSWSFSGRSTRALVFFCDQYTQGYKPRKAFTSILPPNLFMFSTGDEEELICDLLFYPEDILFQDRQTTVQCTGMLPLSLKQTSAHKNIDAQLLKVSLFDHRVQQDFFLLLWLHTTPIVFEILGHSQQNISYYWERNLYQYREERTHSLPLFEQHGITPEYYISSRRMTNLPHLTGFFSDMMYRYEKIKT